MSLQNIRFTSVLLILGLALFLAVFVDHLFRGYHRHPDEPAFDIPDGDPQIGRQAIVEHGCISCHTIPGIRQATGRVGPQLHDFSNQIYIAGRLPNDPDNLVRWIRNPQEVDPGNAMPNLHVTEADARHIAAYLYTLSD